MFRFLEVIALIAVFNLSNAQVVLLKTANSTVKIVNK